MNINPRLPVLQVTTVSSFIAELHHKQRLVNKNTHLPQSNNVCLEVTKKIF